jgi:uncharacterized membrane protein affecting hemolysin expression
MKLQSHHVISIIALVYRRTRRFILALLFIVLIAQLWTNMQASRAEALRQHSHSLLQLTIEQVAQSARTPLITNDNDSLQALVEQLVQHPYILAASIRNNFGQLVVNSEVLEHSAVATSTNTILVENIIDEERNLGFLQVIVDNSQFLASADKTTTD